MYHQSQGSFLPRFDW